MNKFIFLFMISTSVFAGGYDPHVFGGVGHNSYNYQEQRIREMQRQSDYQNMMSRMQRDYNISESRRLQENAQRLIQQKPYPQFPR